MNKLRAEARAARPPLTFLAVASIVFTSFVEAIMTGPFYTADTLEPGTSIGFLMKRCGSLMSQVAERRFAAEPISFTQWIVLALLSQYDHLSPTALSVHTDHDMGALTRIVDDLEHKGLVQRERSEHDRRAVEITLTPAGRKAMQRGKGVVVELLNRLASPYSRQEIETLIGLLQRMLTHLQAAASDERAEVGPATQSPRQQKRSRKRGGA